jgi:hypothetical protein
MCHRTLLCVFHPVSLSDCAQVYEDTRSKAKDQGAIADLGLGLSTKDAVSTDTARKVFKLRHTRRWYWYYWGMIQHIGKLFDWSDDLPNEDLVVASKKKQLETVQPQTRTCSFCLISFLFRMLADDVAL